MRPKTLQWKYTGRAGEYLIGTLPGDSPPIRFALELLSGDRYLIKSDINGIGKKICEGQKATKQEAQQLFNLYAMSLFEMNGGIDTLRIKRKNERK